MSRSQFKAIAILTLITGILVFSVTGCIGAGEGEFRTSVSIKGDKWYFNDMIINPGSPAEGLLMNVRMVNTVFEDRGPELDRLFPGFDPEANTDSFIEKIPEYASSGVNAFVISLQGGMPGYEGAVNTAFNADGSLREDYLGRVERVIRSCDENSTAVIMSLFYQRQHSHESAFTGRESIRRAVKNSVDWIAEKGFTNVVLEVSNEYRHGGYRNWQDGDWFISEAGQAEMIRYARELYPGLLVSTSGMGNGTFHDDLARESDFLLIHFNNTSLEDYRERIDNLKKYGKPIVCNEDDKVQNEGAIGLVLSVLNGAAWGYMNSSVNQYFPLVFNGTEDDPDVYRMYRNMATPGFSIDPDELRHTSITITYPNDGDIFRTGQSLYIRLSHLYPDRSVPYSVELFANDKQVAAVGNNLRVRWQTDEPGIYNFRAVVFDQSGKELYRSANVDIIVQTE